MAEDEFGQSPGQFEVVHQEGSWNLRRSIAAVNGKAMLISTFNRRTKVL